MPHENLPEAHLIEDIIREHLGPNDPLYHQKLANVDTCRRMVIDGWKHGFNAGTRHKPQSRIGKAVAAVKKAATGRK